MVTKHLSVSCISPEQATWDGAAVCQMVLDTAGGSPSQATLAASIAAGNIEPSAFVADPEGIRKALIDNKPSGFTNTFNVHAFGTGAECSNYIARTLHKYEIPPAVLVWSGGHWVCAVGVETDIDPLLGTPYSIDHLWIHNPWPAGMSTCDTWIDYAEWLTDWMNPVVYGTTWNGKYVGVFDPALVATEPPTLKPRPTQDGKTLISARKAAQIAARDLDKRNVLARVPVRKLLQDTDTGEPELVVDLRRPDHMWWHVPLEKKGKTRGVAQIDARFGTLTMAAPLPARWPTVTRKNLAKHLYADEHPVYRTAIRESGTVEAQIGRIRIWEPRTEICNHLVWIPCVESRNPLVPFRLVLISGRSYFLRVHDGRLFDRLHPFVDAVGVGGL